MSPLRARAQGTRAGRRRIGAACLAAWALLLCGCATRYGPASRSIRGGYEDARLDEHTFQVGFKGNGYTSRDTVYRFFLRRCAELALNAGCSHFVIQDYDNFLLARKYDRTYTGVWFDKVEIQGVIKAFGGAVPADNPAAFDARKVLADTEGK